MRGGAAAVDRLLVLATGTGLLLLGLALLELRLEVLRSWPSVLVLDEAQQVLAQPWAFTALAGGGLLVGALGLAWAWLHVPRRAASRVRLASSDPRGRVEVDLDALAEAVAARAGQGTNLSAVGVDTRTDGFFSVIEVSGRLRTGTDAAALVAAAEQLSADLALAFPDDGVTGRLMVDAPGRRARTRRTGSTVVEDARDTRDEEPTAG